MRLVDDEGVRAAISVEVRREPPDPMALEGGGRSDEEL